MKSSLLRLVLIVVIIVASAGAMVWLERTPISRLANILGITVTVSDIEESPSPEPTPVLSDRVPALSLGTVVIETLSGAQVIRTASGTAVTSDGLIITTAAAAPFGTGGYTYRVTSSRGDSVAARRVAYDAAEALVLLKADLADVGTVPFSAVVPRAGDVLTAVAAGRADSAYSAVILSVAVVSAPSENALSLSLDRAFLPILAGARLVDRTGATIGLLRPATVVGSIPASAINAFVSRYLESLRAQ